MVQQHGREKITTPWLGSAQDAVRKSTLGLCCLKEGLSEYKGCKVYSLPIVLFIISNISSYFIAPCVIWPFSLRPTKSFALPCITLPSRAEHPNCPFSILQGCTGSHTTTSTFNNSVTVILLIFAFIFSC